MVERLRQRILNGPAGGQRPLTPEEMVALAESVDLDTVELGGYERFQEPSYARNVVFANEQVELAVICWLPGQSSAVHDHGISNCLYVVKQGEMVEQRFRLDASGRPEPTGERRFGPGDITLAKGEDIHQIHNRTDARLVTIHIYSPPLGESMTLYTPVPRTGGA